MAEEFQPLHNLNILIRRISRSAVQSPPPPSQICSLSHQNHRLRSVSPAKQIPRPEPYSAAAIWRFAPLPAVATYTRSSARPSFSLPVARECAPPHLDLQSPARVLEAAPSDLCRHASAAETLAIIQQPFPQVMRKGSEKEKRKHTPSSNWRLIIEKYLNKKYKGKTHSSKRAKEKLKHRNGDELKDLNVEASLQGDKSPNIVKTSNRGINIRR